MTIAACHVSPEGVVLGADSTTTIVNGANGEPLAHLDYAQKLFEVGKEGSSIGLVTWGQGQIGNESHRTIAALLGQAHATKAAANMAELAKTLGELLWSRYSSAYAGELAFVQDKIARLQAGETVPSDDLAKAVHLRDSLAGGYCLAGRIGIGEQCEAFEIVWNASMLSPEIRLLPQETPLFWGQPQLVLRLIMGVDNDVFAAILNSGHWNGTKDELLAACLSGRLVQPSHLPLREAIDWIHSMIHTTIRAMKFGKWEHYCGGPVEVAAITTDRPFRWVVHKSLDAATATAQEGGRR